MNGKNHKIKKYRRYIIFFAIYILFIIITFMYAAIKRNQRQQKYDKALYFMEIEEYQEAISEFEQLGPYQNSFTLKAEAEMGLLYKDACDAFNNGEYEKAISIFSQLEGYKDSNEKVLESKYNFALLYFDKKDYSKEM